MDLDYITLGFIHEHNQPRELPQSGVHTTHDLAGCLLPAACLNVG